MKKILSILLFAFTITNCFGQYFWVATELAPMPEPISNNAVVEATVNGVMHVFSFAGIDSTKIWSGISNKSFRYNVSTDVWDSIAPLPDSQTKIAAAASNVKNKIYVIGGYTVLSNGNEISSDKVHIYNPDSNNYNANGASIPIPIDDHVQAVWRDSLIFVITGWSNTTNRPEVQIYNPAFDNWSSGTSVPNNNIYKSFGASGVIVGDTIYYFGGASLSGSFNIQNELRMGIIDSLNPTQISWTNPLNFTNEPGYRSAATSNYRGTLFWLGGSKTTYNFNGIAYNGTGGVPPANRYLFAETANLNNWVSQNLVLPMDLRGIAEIDNTLNFVTRIIAGGMEANQKVSNKTLLLQLSFGPGFNELGKNDIIIYPNPAKDFITFDHNLNLKNYYELIISDTEGRVVQKEILNSKQNQFEIRNLISGVYQISLIGNEKYFHSRLIKY